MDTIHTGAGFVFRLRSNCFQPPRFSNYADKKMDFIKIAIVFFTVCAIIGLGASVKSFFELWNDKDENE